MNDIELVKIYDIERINALKDRVFKWAINESVRSEFCKSIPEAVALYEKKILQVFHDEPGGQHCFDISVSNKDIVGEIWLMERKTKENKQIDLRIPYIALGKRHQRRGYAKKAIHLAERHARNLGYNTLSLNVFSHLPHARKII